LPVRQLRRVDMQLPVPVLDAFKLDTEWTQADHSSTCSIEFRQWDKQLVAWVNGQGRATA
jgi:hypothetical protein